MLSKLEMEGRRVEELGEGILAEHMELIEEELERVFEGHDHPKELYDMMRYHLGWLDERLKPVKQYRGKRFRPVICLLTYNALSGVYDKALPAAAAIELVHNFSLIHDDIEDMDEERRHKPTVWKLWGVPKAINVGDGMHVLSNLAALRLKELNISHSKIVDAIEILNRTIIALCEGQHLDMSYEGRVDITTDMYMEMISKKTAALIEAAAHTGALLATNNEELIASFRNFGRKIGLAFQIVDDLLGVWEPAERTGKPRASDIRNRKKTLPVIYAFQNAKGRDKKRLLDLYKGGKMRAGEIAEVLRILEDCGARTYSNRMAEDLKKEALAELHETGIENEAMEKLEHIARFLVERTY